MHGARGQKFTYEGFDVDPAAGTITSRYSLDGRGFQEVVSLPAELDWRGPRPGGAARGLFPLSGRPPRLESAARVLFLLSGVSYYKTAAPPVIDLGSTPVGPDDVAFLREFYLEGLGEFSYVNELNLDDLQIVGGVPAEPEPAPG